jgi:hypothetical protein
MSTTSKPLTRIDARAVVGSPAKSRPTPAQRREALREKLWPGYESQIWSRKRHDGFVSVPRLIPLVLHIISHLSQRGDPSLVYLDLWSRSFDEGLVSIYDESECAYSAGYTGTRAVRTWREHMLQLVELGFIKTKPEGIREMAHVLLLNPLEVCAKLRTTRTSRIPDEWWTAFIHRAQEIGAEIPA